MHEDMRALLARESGFPSLVSSFDVLFLSLDRGGAPPTSADWTEPLTLCLSPAYERKTEDGHESTDSIDLVDDGSCRNLRKNRVRYESQDYTRVEKIHLCRSRDPTADRLLNGRTTTRVGTFSCD